MAKSVSWLHASKTIFFSCERPSCTSFFFTLFSPPLVPSFIHHPPFHAGFLSLPSSHTVAFLRAMEAGLAGPDGHQAEVAKTDASWQCIQNGWEWVAISSQVEESIPELPTWFQMGMNSSNSTGKPGQEIDEWELWASTILLAVVANIWQAGLAFDVAFFGSFGGLLAV